jgi:hypothetical protein
MIDRMKLIPSFDVIEVFLYFTILERTFEAAVSPQLLHLGQSYGITLAARLYSAASRNIP